MVEQELPETAASMRLSGLELSDCIAEMSALSSDLTSGVRAGARMISSTEGGLRQAGAALGQTVSGKVVPALAGTEGQARGEGPRPSCCGRGRAHFVPYDCSVCLGSGCLLPGAAGAGVGQEDRALGAGCVHPPPNPACAPACSGAASPNLP